MLLPGIIRDALESTRRQKLLLRQIVQRELKENPPASGRDATDDQVARSVEAYVSQHPILVNWPQVGGKPSTFPPSAHVHYWSEVTEKPSSFPAAAHTHAWADVTGKPSSFPPDVHTHSWESITNKPAQIGSSALPLVGQVTLAETAILNVNLTVRRVTVALAGAVTTGAYVAVPVSAPPVGYSVQDAVCSNNNQITVAIICPPAQLLTSYSIPVRIYRLNQ